MTKRTRAEQARRAEWYARPPWPCVVLGVDPGSDCAGAALAAPDEGLVWARAVDSETTELEDALDEAADLARIRSLRLVLVLEDWGRGGPLGIQGWMGLGAARGHWKRAALIAARGRHEDVLPSILKIWTYAFLGSWRSMMDVPALVEVGGRMVRCDRENEGWKRNASRRLAELAPRARVDSSDAAEAALIALYGQRCDEVGDLLPKRYLREHGR